MVEFRAGGANLAPYQFQEPLPQSHPKMIYNPVIILAVILLPNPLKQSQALQLSGRDTDCGFTEPQVPPDIIKRAVASGQINITLILHEHQRLGNYFSIATACKLFFAPLFFLTQRVMKAFCKKR